ncbi:MAG TPA: hypothetical protein VFW09_17920 [Solirubrobacteraceae bacterium]|nr:hypothetical protein [Solirubrobacteraceae bacterium]
MGRSRDSAPRGLPRETIAVGREFAAQLCVLLLQRPRTPLEDLDRIREGVDRRIRVVQTPSQPLEL